MQTLDRRSRRAEQALIARRNSLRYRLAQAKSTEWNWPSARSAEEVHRIEAELDKINHILYVRPTINPLFTI